MRVKLMLTILFIIGLSFIVSCASEPEIEPSAPAIYIVKTQAAEEPQVKTFVVGEKSNIAWIDATKQQRHELNKIRALRDYEDEQEEFEYESRLRNVVRSVDNELIIGYDEELDNPRFREVES